MFRGIGFDGFGNFFLRFGILGRENVYSCLGLEVRFLFFLVGLGM